MTFPGCSVLVLVLLVAVSRMIVGVRAVVPVVGMIVNLGFGSMIVGVLVLVQVFVGVFMHVVVGVSQLPMPMFMFMLMFMGMRVAMQVLVFMFSFHWSTPCEVVADCRECLPGFYTIYDNDAGQMCNESTGKNPQVAGGCINGGVRRAASRASRFLADWIGEIIRHGCELGFEPCKKWSPVFICHK
jgi:hypothetical protein